MIKPANIPKIVTFSPKLHAADASANYWIRQVTLRLRREICWARHERGVLPGSDGAGLPPFVDKASASLGMSRRWDEKRKFFHADTTACYLTEQLKEDPPGDRNSQQGSFGWAIDQLDLDDAAAFALGVGLVISFDSAAGNVIAACLNDPARTYPNLSLVQMLWDEPEEIFKLADLSHPLFRYGLLHRTGRISSQYPGGDWEDLILVPALVAGQLLFPDSPLPRALVHVSTDGQKNVTMTQNTRLLASRLNTGGGDSLRLIPIRGPRNSGHVEVVRGLADMADRTVFELKHAPDLLEDDRYLKSIVTLCWLKGIDLFLGQDFTSMLDRDKRSPGNQFQSLQSIPINIFLRVTERNQLTSIPPDLLLPTADVPEFSYHRRIAHWKKRLGATALGLEGVIEECSRRFRYEKETIDGISAGLNRLPGPISEKDFIAACRAEMDLDIGDLAQRVNPRFSDEELILPYRQELQFQEILNAMNALTEIHYGWGTAGAWNESGISVLFSGPPGTGKTMAAEVLAGRLDLPMFRIDLSQVVNKYIGETEKNLKKLFDTADASDLIIFFDEADALFGRRTEVRDAHDRYANLEISYLLERMERFKGLAILATNRKKDLDTAFLRRLRFIVDFPLPGPGQRKKIWRQLIPKAADCSKLDFDFLARQFPLAGGHIRSIIFNACLQSASGRGACHDGPGGRLAMEQIIVAVKREYDKINRSVSLEHFGPYAEIVRRMEHEDGGNQD